jgi:gas vesicle protein
MMTRFGITLAVLLLAAAAPGVALATDGSGNSSVDQYLETLPGAGGKTVPGSGKETKSPLLAQASQALNQVNSQTANALRQVATSSSYGAPGKLTTSAKTGKLVHRPGKNVKNHVKNHVKSTVTATKPASPSFPSSLGAAITSPGSGSENRLIGLLIALMTITGIAAVAAALKQRKPTI